MRAIFLAYRLPHSLWRHMAGLGMWGKALWCLSQKSTNLIMKAPPLQSHLNLIISLKPISKIHYIGCVNFSVDFLGGGGQFNPEYHLWISSFQDRNWNISSQGKISILVILLIWLSSAHNFHHYNQNNPLQCI